MKKLHRTGYLPAPPAGFEPGLAAARALAQTKRLAEAQVASALEVSIGFSDADGD
jgi:predicted lipoprotein